MIPAFALYEPRGFQVTGANKALLQVCRRRNLKPFNLQRKLDTWDLVH